MRLSIKDINNKLYEDVLTVYRYRDVQNEDMSTTHKLVEADDIKNIKCMLSIKAADNPQPEDVNSVMQVYTVFTDNLIDIKSGDLLKITSHGKTYEMVAGEPARYKYHNEIPVSYKEWS